MISKLYRRRRQPYDKDDRSQHLFLPLSKQAEKTITLAGARADGFLYNQVRIMTVRFFYVAPRETCRFGYPEILLSKKREVRRSHWFRLTVFI
jgi:hypothetical protein